MSLVLPEKNWDDNITVRQLLNHGLPLLFSEGAIVVALVARRLRRLGYRVYGAS